MPMNYPYIAIAESEIPRASSQAFQHLLDTYASETNKLVSVWREFDAQDFSFKPHPRSSSVRQIMEHQLLSERRFFGEFLGVPEPPPDQVLPATQTPEAYAARALELARPRLGFLSSKGENWWIELVPFFDVERQRIWVFWRRVLHTTHHRSQLTVYLRLLGRKVPSTYGPTADVTWHGADPTTSVDAAGRR
ncbi:MAG: damage-inducible protein DinB [Acidobacteria bacterium]|nr:MAG: damage-inducible protein DinB [Acidobacteriota bacterium]